MIIVTAKSNNSKIHMNKDYIITMWEQNGYTQIETNAIIGMDTYAVKETVVEILNQINEES